MVSEPGPSRISDAPTAGSSSGEPVAHQRAETRRRSRLDNWWWGDLRVPRLMDQLDRSHPKNAAGPATRRCPLVCVTIEAPTTFALRRSLSARRRAGRRDPGIPVAREAHSQTRSAGRWLGRLTSWARPDSPVALRASQDRPGQPTYRLVPAQSEHLPLLSVY